MVTIADVSTPTGELDRALLFPSLTQAQFEEKIDGWIADAIARVPTASDAAIIAWVYHRAFSAVHVRLAATPHRADLEEGGSYSYLQSQIKAFKDLADYWDEQWDLLITVVGTETTQPALTGSVSNEFVP